MKLYLKGDRCYTEKCAIEKRNFIPGQHGRELLLQPVQIRYVAAGDGHHREAASGRRQDPQITYQEHRGMRRTLVDSFQHRRNLGRYLRDALRVFEVTA